MKKTTLALALALAFSSPALAKKGRHGGGDKIFKQLDLSKEQKEKLKEVRSSRKEKLQELRGKMKEARKAFHEALNSNASNSKLKSLHQDLIKSSTNFKEYKFETMLKTRELLTEDQKKKFGELKHNKRRKGDSEEE